MRKRQRPVSDWTRRFQLYRNALIRLASQFPCVSSFPHTLLFFSLFLFFIFSSFYFFLFFIFSLFHFFLFSLLIFRFFYFLIFFSFFSHLNPYFPNVSRWSLVSSTSHSEREVKKILLSYCSPLHLTSTFRFCSLRTSISGFEFLLKRRTRHREFFLNAFHMRRVE